MCLHAPTVRAHAGGIVDELRVVASGTAVLNLPQDPLVMSEMQRSTEYTPSEPIKKIHLKKVLPTLTICGKKPGAWVHKLVK